MTVVSAAVTNRARLVRGVEILAAVVIAVAVAGLVLVGILAQPHPPATSGTPSATHSAHAVPSAPGGCGGATGYGKVQPMCPPP
jgi:hypothetical protein